MKRPAAISRRTFSSRAAKACLGFAFAVGLLRAGIARAASDEDDPEILVRATAPDPKTFRRVVREYSLELVRVLDFEKPDGRVTALLLIRKKVFPRVAQDPRLRLQLEAPAVPGGDQRPVVGQGNRFADPNVLPRGQGVLVRP